MLRKFFVVLPVAVFVIGTSTACATKKFVKTSVAEVNDKVDSLGRSVKATEDQDRARAIARENEIDQKAQAAAQAAQQANAAAASAASAASAAGTAAAQANSKIDAMDRANRRLVYEAVLSERQGNFKLGKAELPDETKAKLDQIVQQLKADPKNVYFEIEGHTDNAGSAALNERLGYERADNVKKYLYEKYQIPLHKMSVISYGKEKPAVPNNNKDNRAQNRRVVIKILS